MAKKAGGDTTTTWILLLEARALVVRAYDGAVKKAEDLLKKWLGDGRGRWSCKLFEPAPVSELAALNARDSGIVVIGLAEVAYSAGDPAFWRAWLEINWEENSAREMSIGGNKAFGIRVVREDVLALLPEEPDEHKKTTASGVWMAAEARRMKEAGEIPPTISEFARELERRMDKAADTDRSIRRLKWKSIRNVLGKLGLWPPTLIK
jgi:hypothetical protein